MLLNYSSINSSTVGGEASSSKHLLGYLIFDSQPATKSVIVLFNIH